MKNFKNYCSIVTSKDEQRIDDIIRKANGDENKAEQLARTMAQAINNPNKALARAMAAENINYHYLAQIFYSRANELGATLIEKLEKLTGKKVVLKEGPIGFRPSYMGEEYTVTIPVIVLVDIDIEGTSKKDAKNKALTNIKINNIKFEKDIADQIIQDNSNIKIISAQTLPVLKSENIAIEAKFK